MWMSRVDSSLNIGGFSISMSCFIFWKRFLIFKTATGGFGDSTSLLGVYVAVAPIGDIIDSRPVIAPKGDVIEPRAVGVFSS